MDLDTDATYEAFQFWWYALYYAPPTKTPFRLEVEEALRHKLVSISAAKGDGGRVLQKECCVDLTTEERMALVERIGEMGARGGWTPEAAPHAAAASRLLFSRPAGPVMVPVGRPVAARGA